MGLSHRHLLHALGVLWIRAVIERSELVILGQRRGVLRRLFTVRFFNEIPLTEEKQSQAMISRTHCTVKLVRWRCSSHVRETIADHQCLHLCCQSCSNHLPLHRSAVCESGCSPSCLHRLSPPTAGRTQDRTTRIASTCVASCSESHFPSRDVASCVR
jgi:hypothetical protein